MTHEFIRTNLESSICAACERIETLETCLVQNNATIASLEGQVGTLTLERDARPTVESHQSVIAELALAQALPAELRLEIETLRAEIARLNAAIDAAQAATIPPA